MFSYVCNRTTHCMKLHNLATWAVPRPFQCWRERSRHPLTEWLTPKQMKLTLQCPGRNNCFVVFYLLILNWVLWIASQSPALTSGGVEEGLNTFRRKSATITDGADCPMGDKDLGLLLTVASPWHWVKDYQPPPSSSVSRHRRKMGFSAKTSVLNSIFWWDLKSKSQLTIHIFSSQKILIRAGQIIEN